MPQTRHTYAIAAAPDGKFYLLYARSAVEDGKAIAATTWPDRQNPRPFDSEAAAIAFAKSDLGAIDDDFAPHPGQP